MPRLRIVEVHKKVCLPETSSASSCTAGRDDSSALEGPFGLGVRKERTERSPALRQCKDLVPTRYWKSSAAYEPLRRDAALDLSISVRAERDMR